MLSVLAGHWRYAHINAIQADGINPELLGMSGVASEDSVRRGMKAMDEAASGQWLKAHLKASYEPLLLADQRHLLTDGWRNNVARCGDGCFSPAGQPVRRHCGRRDTQPWG